MDVMNRDTILQAARSKKEITCKGTPLRFTADLSEETLQAQRQWWDIVKKLNEMNVSPRILCLAKLSLKLERTIHYLTDEQQLKNFIDSKPNLKEGLKGLL